MNEITARVFNYLKDSGLDVKLSGGTVKDALGLKDSEYRAAKSELKEAGVVTLGRGRGGTISLVEDAEPPAEPKKLSKAEIMAGAREEKEAKGKQEKFHARVFEYGRKVAEDKFPDNKTEVHIVKADHQNGWAEFHVWVWSGRKAKVFGGYYDE